jgi:hypothetical protein
MTRIEDDIREALRAEAARLRGVRPLRLTPSHSPAPHLARRPWAWLAPLAAATVVTALAIALVALHSLQNEPLPAAPQPSAQPTAQPSATRPFPQPSASPPSGQIPRYSVGFGDWDGNGNGFVRSYVVSDSLSGAKLGTVTAPKGTGFFGIPAAAAGDRQTFIVGATIPDPNPVLPYTTTGPVGWYQIRLSPGSARPVQMTRLPIPANVTDLPVIATGLSADGRYLAVGFGSSVKLQEDLRVYAVATGQLAGNWTMTIGKDFGHILEIRGLHWVNGDSTVGVTLRSSTLTHEEVRTVALGVGGGDLLAASHVVWSQNISPPAHGDYTDSTPLLCGTPFLTADGQTVVCANKTYSAADKATTLELLAYPIATPTTPRVIGSLRIRTFVDPFHMAVEWADPSGSTVIGCWPADFLVNGSQVQYLGVASGGTYHPLPRGASIPGGGLAF